MCGTIGHSAAQTTTKNYDVTVGVHMERQGISFHGKVVTRVSSTTALAAAQAAKVKIESGVSQLGLNTQFNDSLEVNKVD